MIAINLNRVGVNAGMQFLNLYIFKESYKRQIFDLCVKFFVGCYILELQFLSQSNVNSIIKSYVSFVSKLNSGYSNV